MEHVVKQGESISTIAQSYGLLPGKIWNDTANDGIRQNNGDPNILEPGDRVFIPDISTKSEDVQADARATFLRKGIPDMLSLKFVDMNNEPRSGLVYKLDFGSKSYDGTTDSDGLIEHPLPPKVNQAKLFIDGEVHQIELSYLDPVSSMSGLQARLANLGFECGKIDGNAAEKTRLAILEFQRRKELNESGEFDDSTLEALSNLYQV